MFAIRLPRLAGIARVIAALQLLAVGSPAQALYENDARFTVRGFATAGAVYNPSQHLEFVRDFSQPEGARNGWNARPESLIGLQLNTWPAPDWEAVVQVISRYSYHDDFRPRLSWAFVKYSPSAGVTVRAGRLGYDAYLEGDTRNVGYAHLPVRLPIEYYGTLELSHIDGADLVFAFPVGNSLLSLKLFAGRADEVLAVGVKDDYELDGSRAVGGSVNAHAGAWRLRLGASTVHLDKEIASLEMLSTALRNSGSSAAAGLADDIQLEGADIANINAAAVFDGAALHAGLHYNYRRTNTLAVSDGRAVHGLIGYRVGVWTPFVFATVSDSETDTFDSGLPAGHPLDIAAARIVEGAPFDQRAVGLGVRHDLGSRAAVKLQIEQIDAESTENSFFARSNPRWDGDAMVFSATVDCIF